MRPAIGRDALREMVHFQRELVLGADLDLLDHRMGSRPMTDAHGLPAIREGVLKVDPGLLQMDPQRLAVVSPVAREAVRDHARREAQHEGHVLLDLAEAQIVRRAPLAGEDLHRLLTEIGSGRVEAVEADVGQRPASRHRLLHPPLVGTALLLGVDGVDELDGAELA